MAPLALTWETAAFTAVVTVAAYLIGSIPTAYLVVRRRRGQDIRQLGDGNAGAENVARILGRKAGVIVALIDLSKGLVVILLVRGLAALVGGDFPVSPAIPAIPAIPLFELFQPMISRLLRAAGWRRRCWPGRRR